MAPRQLPSSGPMSAFRREFAGGWRNLLAATIGLGFGIPCYTPVSSLFFRALGTQFGWSKAVAAGALVALPIAAFTFPFVGRLIDRFGVRAMSGFSVAAAVLAYVWLSFLSGSVGEYYAAIIALNVLGCATGPMCYTVLVAAQFREARGAALACAQFGIAFVAVLFPPIIGAMMSRYGWRGGYLLLAATTLAGGAVAQVLMRPVRGMAAQPQPRAGVTAPGAEINTRRATSSCAFWLLGLAVLAISIASIGLVSAFQSVLVERGIAETTAPWFLSLLAFSVMLSRLVVGRILDLNYPARYSAVVMVLAAIGAGLLLTPPSIAVTSTATVLVGFSIGAELDLMAFFCARLFGLTHYGAIYGLLAIFFYVGMALGGFGYGLIRDRAGGYEPALWMTTVLLAVAGGLFLGLEREDRITSHRRQQGASHVAS
jgi:predicted MFS family arabinose efflux permease